MSQSQQPRHRSIIVTILLILQSIAALFFVGDVLGDMRTSPLGFHTIFETLVAVALVFGAGLSIWFLSITMEHIGAQDRALATARGDLARTISQQFEVWGLTPAERDVGFLALKGLDVVQIAGIRGAAPGTVRAQLTRIYAKAGVSGRPQFAAWFVEDLLAEGIDGDTAKQ